MVNLLDKPKGINGLYLGNDSLLFLQTNVDRVRKIQAYPISLEDSLSSEAAQ